MTFQIQQVMRSRAWKWSEAGEWHSSGAILKHTSVTISHLCFPQGLSDSVLGHWVTPLGTWEWLLLASG